MSTSHHLPFAVVINGEKVVEHDRNKRLTGIQRRFLDEMDQKMTHDGLQMGDEKITSPDALQKAQYIANTLIHALQKENDSLAAACSSYLARRLPDLQQVKAKTEKNGTTMIELVFDRSFEKASSEQAINFINKRHTDA